MLSKSTLKNSVASSLAAIVTGAFAFVAMTGSSHALVLTGTNYVNQSIDYAYNTDIMNIAGGTTIFGVTVTIDFTKCGGSISEPTCYDPGKPYYDEIVFKLTHGTTTVDLVTADTYSFSNTNPGVPTAVTFDDLATDIVGTTNSGMPETGTFRPIGSLADVLGDTAAGAWGLYYSDDEAPDPLWVTSWTINITTEDPAPPCCAAQPDPEPEPEPPIAVSEPGTLAILGLGIIGLGISRRRKSA